MKKTIEEKFWQSNFAKGYLVRNHFTNKQLNSSYIKKFGTSRSEMNKKIMRGLKIESALEVGCNVGNQLSVLQSQGYKNLYGVEIYSPAVEMAKKHTNNINIIQGSAFDLPFKDNYFDLVFTSGLLIHINPKDLKKVMREISRVSKKYVWGFEYFSDKPETVKYRTHKDRLWKANFAKIYQNTSPSLKLLSEDRYKYLDDENIDTMFLLSKKTRK